MHEEFLIHSLFVIFVGASILATLALWTRQSILVAYIALGVLLGPWGFGLVQNSGVISGSGQIGIIFLLFLLGLNLPITKLRYLLRQVSIVGIVSSLIFLGLGFGVAWVFGFQLMECILIGAATMFSSTIIGIKLLPTTILHHQHTGEVMIAVLLFQDLLAIIVLVLLQGPSAQATWYQDVAHLFLGLPGLLCFAFVVEKYVLLPIFSCFDRVKEYLFLGAIAWCLGVAQLAAMLNLSYEIGAFIAGVSLATGPLSVYVSESLKPVRDFFLILFFFSVGAGFDFYYWREILWPTVVLLIAVMCVKPICYAVLLRQVGEKPAVSWEVGVRLAQVSEFSLIISATALDLDLISPAAAYLIEGVSILSFLISSYWVVLRYPTPMALSDKLRCD